MQYNQVWTTRSWPPDSGVVDGTGKLSSNNNRNYKDHHQLIQYFNCFHQQRELVLLVGNNTAHCSALRCDQKGSSLAVIGKLEWKAVIFNQIDCADTTQVSSLGWNDYRILFQVNDIN